jgi:hypothetical protein
MGDYRDKPLGSITGRFLISLVTILTVQGRPWITELEFIFQCMKLSLLNVQQFSELKKGRIEHATVCIQMHTIKTSCFHGQVPFLASGVFYNFLYLLYYVSVQWLHYILPCAIFYSKNLTQFICIGPQDSPDFPMTINHS